MLPRIKISYLNGQLGTVGESPDGLFALLCVAMAVGETFALETAYSVRSLADLEELGVTAENNEQLHRHVSDFYGEAENGTELVVWGFAESAKVSELLHKDSGKVKDLLMAENGKLRGLFVSGAAETAGADGLGADTVAAIPVAQALAEWSTTDLYAPIFVVLEGKGATKNAKDLSAEQHNRVAVLVGDTTADSGEACVGVMAGRLASIPVHRNLGRVKDGALAPTEMYIGTKEAGGAMSDVAELHERGYITPRRYVGAAGYYFSDDRMACKVTDDYSHISARRVIDKAYRIAYDTILQYMLDEIEVNEDGTMQAAVIKSWQQSVENAINRSMTAAGELSAEGGEGCECYIDEKQNVLSTSRVEVTLRVRPYAYARYIDVNLGFQVNG